MCLNTSLTVIELIKNNKMTESLISIPTPDGDLTLTFGPGGTTVFIGANGSGKTRLGVYLDRNLASGMPIHRISAHRSLTLPANVQPSNSESAMKLLKYGTTSGDNYAYKQGHRWKNAPETAMLDDFDHLLAALYAEENDVSVRFRQNYLPNSNVSKPETKLDRLCAIWHRLLPHRELVVLSSNMTVRLTGASESEYSASIASDGERTIFYLLGQSLLAAKDSILLIDEPELHINKAIVSKLFDEIEAARRDCAFAYITHDVEFAASRHAAVKYVLYGYLRTSGETWDIRLIPVGTDIPEAVLAVIVGSRLPVLFVEGDAGSLDTALYRRLYHHLTVIPVGNCDAVIHTVASFKARSELHRVGCAGLIDADGRTPEEITALRNKGIYVLAVSEVENVFLLPNPFMAIATLLLFDESTARSKLESLKTRVFEWAARDQNRTCLSYTRRRIDRLAKRIGLTSADITELDVEFTDAVTQIQPSVIFSDVHDRITQALNDKDYETILMHYDNKGLLAEAAKELGCTKTWLEEFIGRSMNSNSSKSLSVSLSYVLPEVTVSG